MLANAPARGTFNGVALRSKAFAPAVSSRVSSVQVTNAITRVKKEAIVSDLKTKLEGSAIVFGMRFKGLSVATVEKFRQQLPEAADVFVCKNTLMKGENAWVFVPEDAMQDTVKAYFKFEDDLFTEAKKVAPKNTTPKSPTEVSVVVMDNNYLTTEQLKAIEKLPTKKQLIATVAMLAKQPATKLATGIKAVPTKLAIALKKVSELDDDKTKTLASVVKA